MALKYIIGNSVDLVNIIKGYTDSDKKYTYNSTQYTIDTIDFSSTYGTTIDLNNKSLGNNAIIGLSYILKKKNIGTLWLQNNYIQDSGAIAIADALAPQKTLIKLWLDTNNITDIGCFRLAAMMSNKNIKELSLTRNIFTMNGVKSLATILCIKTSLTMFKIENDTIKQSNIYNTNGTLLGHYLLILKYNNNIVLTNVDKLWVSQTNSDVYGYPYTFDKRTLDFISTTIDSLIKNVNNDNIVNTYYLYDPNILQLNSNINLQNYKQNIVIKTVLIDMMLNRNIELNVSNTFNAVLDDIPIAPIYKSINITNNNLTYKQLQSFFNNIIHAYKYSSTLPTLIWDTGNSLIESEITQLYSLLGIARPTTSTGTTPSTGTTKTIAPTISTTYEINSINNLIKLITNFKKIDSKYVNNTNTSEIYYNINVGYFTTINIINNIITVDGAIILAEVLSKSNNITSITLNTNNLNIESIKILAPLFTKFNYVNLYNNNIGDEGMIELIKYTTNVSTLDLAKNNIGASGIFNLAKMLDKFVNLKEINLDNNNITKADDILWLDYIKNLLKTITTIPTTLKDVQNITSTIIDNNIIINYTTTVEPNIKALEDHIKKELGVENVIVTFTLVEGFASTLYNITITITAKDKVNELSKYINDNIDTLLAVPSNKSYLIYIIILIIIIALIFALLKILHKI